MDVVPGNSVAEESVVNDILLSAEGGIPLVLDDFIKEYKQRE